MARSTCVYTGSIYPGCIDLRERRVLQQALLRRSDDHLGLKRKDFAGAIINQDKEEDAKKLQGKKGPGNTSGADIGKIVQYVTFSPRTYFPAEDFSRLMSGDANRVGNHISGMYFIYGAPFEIIFAATFLYQLMGWTACVIAFMRHSATDLITVTSQLHRIRHSR